MDDQTDRTTFHDDPTEKPANPKTDFANLQGSQRVLGIRQLREAHPQFSEGQIRDWIWRNVAGFRERCVRRIGRRIYIAEGELFAWLNDQRERGRR